MTDPRTYLQDVLAKAEAATEGPWEVYSVPATRKEAGYVAVEASETEVRIARYEGGHFDGAHIASSRTSVPAMARALLAVLDLMDDPAYQYKTRGDFDTYDQWHEGASGALGATLTAITTELAKEIEHG